MVKPHQFLIEAKLRKDIAMARPEILYPLFATLTTLPGIGKKKSRTLERLNIRNVGDLLFLLPYDVIDRRLKDDLSIIKPGKIVTVRVQILHHRKGKFKHQPYRVTVKGAGQIFELVFFRTNQSWIKRLLPVGVVRIVSGKMEIFNDNLQISHPDLVMTEVEARQLPPFEPVYPLTQGITQKGMRKIIQSALATIPDLPEWQSTETLQKFGWPSWANALRMIHTPVDCNILTLESPARERLAYDELLAGQLALDVMRAQMRYGAGRITKGTTKLTKEAKDVFEFSPTNSQVRTLEEIKIDMASPARMLRLLQGDVGTGKTWVAMMAMLIAVEAGGQATLMVPTEILANQHTADLSRIANAIGVNLILLTSRDAGNIRKNKLATIGDGSAQIVIGTHALFQKDITFRDLRLAVIDEQHRFGVHQRMALVAKAPAGADILVMSATPIPRTLALAEYGNLDFSTLDEKPPERWPVETRLISRDRYEEVIDRLSRALDRGLQVYWVCPLIEENKATDLIAVEKRYQNLASRLGSNRVDFVHGKISNEEKNTKIRAFRTGKTQLLITSTIIEVGVNVPKATIIVIEQAEYFGLSQLHQLRGRVGRGAERSFCLLLYDPPLGEVARERLEAMRFIQDGFRIAEEDLRLRGHGDLIGTAQSGMPKYLVADLDRVHVLLEHARAEIRLILFEDSELISSRGNKLNILLYLMGEFFLQKYQ